MTAVASPSVKEGLVTFHDIRRAKDNCFPSVDANTLMTILQHFSGDGVYPDMLTTDEIRVFQRHGLIPTQEAS